MKKLKLKDKVALLEQEIKEKYGFTEVEYTTPNFFTRLLTCGNEPDAVYAIDAVVSFKGIRNSIDMEDLRKYIFGDIEYQIELIRITSER